MGFGVQVLGFFLFLSPVFRSQSVHRQNAYWAETLCEGPGGRDSLPDTTTWRFMGSYKWSYKSPDIGYNYSRPTCNLTYNFP